MQAATATAPPEVAAAAGVEVLVAGVEVLVAGVEVLWELLLEPLLPHPARSTPARSAASSQAEGRWVICPP
ncbi:MAG: hypothetical protein ACLQMH_16545 [Solirubrobacteraceae bacterium]